MSGDLSKTIGADNTGLVVLGMHRSGSSCLAGMLQCAGFSGGNVFLWNEDNRKGNQEDLRVIELNNLVLGESGGSWSAPPDRLAWTAASEAQRDKLLSEFAGSRLPWMFKDPRTVFTLPFWTEGIASPRLLGIFRNPLSVAQSLSTRNGFPLLKGLELWVTYNAALIREHEQAPFPIVCFDLPRGEFIASVSAALQKLGADLVRAGRVRLELLDEFFDDSLVHQVIGSDHPMDALESLPGVDSILKERLSAIYSQLCSLSGCKVSKTSGHGHGRGADPAAILAGLIRIEEATANGNLDAAYQACDELLSSSPRRADLWMRLLGLAKAMGDATRIDSAITRGLAMLPDDPYLWLELAKLKWRLEVFDEAFRAAERAAAIAADWVEPRLQLASWESGRQRWAEVSKWLAPLVAEGKGNRWTRALLGIAFKRLGNDDRGNALIAEAIEEMTPKEKEGALSLRAWALAAPIGDEVHEESDRERPYRDLRPSMGVASALAALQRELENMEPLLDSLSSELVLPQRSSGNSKNGLVEDKHRLAGEAARSSVRVFAGRVFFDHLPKTAGTAVNAWLVEALGSSCVSPNLPGVFHRDLIRQHGGEYSVICAHVHFEPGGGLDPRYQYMTLLRDPLDRVVSWLYFLINSYDDTHKLRALAQRFLVSDGQDVPDGLKGLSNFYVDHFCRINGRGTESDDAKVANALAAIKQYEVVGLYHEMPRFLADAARLFGLLEVPKIHRVNVTKHRPKVEQILPVLWERIAALNQLDLRLYAEVVAWKATCAPAESGQASQTIAPITQHAGRLVVTTPVSVMVPGERRGIHVEVMNCSDQAWVGDSLHPINLACHWLSISGQMVIFEGQRTLLPENRLDAGKSIGAEVLVDAPNETGTYVLVLTLVQEFVAWFEDRGFDAARLVIEVEGMNQRKGF